MWSQYTPVRGWIRHSTRDLTDHPTCTRRWYHDQRTSPVGLGVFLTPAISAHARELRAINIPKGEHDVVQLQLALNAGRTGPYRAELTTTEGTFVLSADSLKPSDSPPRIGFEVPARLLKTGDYQVRLSRSDGASQENVATYYFRVR